GQTLTSAAGGLFEAKRRRNGDFFRGVRDGARRARGERKWLNRLGDTFLSCALLPLCCGRRAGQPCPARVLRFWASNRTPNNNAGGAVAVRRRDTKQPVCRLLM